VLWFNSRGLGIITMWSSATYSQALDLLWHLSLYILSLCPWMLPPPPPSLHCSHVETLVKDQGEVMYCSKNGLPPIWMIYSHIYFVIFMSSISL
jgi:hypothetical protein